MAATYDVENAGRDDIDFYLRLADSLGARDVIDLGCGTGVLAVELAQSGRRVAGIDPAEAMIDIARRRKGGERVRWIVGTFARMRRSSADLIVMSGHVAQLFVEDAEWAAVLANAHRALRAGGHLAFEARDPRARPWTAWTRDATEASYAPPGQPPFRSWVAVTTADDGVVTFDAHVAFDDSGEELVAPETLRFRTADEIAASLDSAGFRIDALYGTWAGDPVTGETDELIYIANRS